MKICKSYSSAIWLRGAIAVAVVTLAFGAPSSAIAQRQRLAPPEASRAPWISNQSEAGLQQGIAYFERVTGAGGWPLLPDKITMRPGDSNENVATLRRRLQVSGDLKSGGDSNEFDQDVEAAVKRFQQRHGLEPTGVIYGITQRSLNVPAAERLKQLQVNLARIQQLAPKVATSPKYIIMNAANFELQGISGGRVEISSRIISGKRATPSPVVSATVQAINILPYWHVPGTIAKAALVPTVRKDPSYLYKERIRVFSSFGGEEIDPALVNWWGPESERYVFRQDPGPQNALGVLRFDMPNKHIVYMHDTPMKNLFGYFERAFSAGCIRVQGFISMAEWVLAGQDGWSRASIEAAVAAGSAKTIKLAKPVPVHFIYLTAWAENGQLQFRNDLYNRDDTAAAAGDDAVSRVLNPQIAP